MTVSADLRLIEPEMQDSFTSRSVWWFFLATFVLSWGVGMVYVAFADLIESVFGAMGYTNPVFILMVYAPGFVGLFLVWRHFGFRGWVRSFAG